jgi:hypothetical protein
MLMAHKFWVGQTVDLTPTMLRQAATGEYEVRRLLPLLDGMAGNPSYRIKSVRESHERVVHESEITLSARPESVFPDGRHEQARQ